MNKTVRYYIQTTGEQPIVRSVAVDRPMDSLPVRSETHLSLVRPTEKTSFSGVRRIRAAIKRGGL